MNDVPPDAWPPRPSWAFAAVTLTILAAALLTVWFVDYLSL